MSFTVIITDNTISQTREKQSFEEVYNLVNQYADYAGIDGYTAGRNNTFCDRVNPSGFAFDNYVAEYFLNDYCVLKLEVKKDE